MDRPTRVVFDRHVGQTKAYTKIDDALWLAGARQIGLEARVLCTTSAAILHVAIEHSADGAVFTSKQPDGSEEIQANVPANGGVFQVYGAEPAPLKPNLKYVRLAVWRTEGSPALPRVTIRATLSGANERSAAAPSEPQQTTAFAAAAGSHEGMLAMSRELQSLARASKDLSPEQRAAHLLGNMSDSAREHLRVIDQKLMSMPEEHRNQIAHLTGQFLRTAFQLAGHPSQKGLGGTSSMCCESSSGLGPASEKKS